MGSMEPNNSASSARAARPSSLSAEVAANSADRRSSISIPGTSSTATTIAMTTVMSMSPLAFLEDLRRIGTMIKILDAT